MLRECRLCTFTTHTFTEQGQDPLSDFLALVAVDEESIPHLKVENRPQPKVVINSTSLMLTNKLIHTLMIEQAGVDYS